MIGRSLSPERVRRVRAAIVGNLVSDVIAQVTIIVVALRWVNSPWLWLIAAVRLALLAGVGIGSRSLREGRVAGAVMALTAYHSVVALTTVFVVPVFAPLAILVLVGDVVLATMLRPNQLRQVSVGLWVVVAACAALSLQSWTDLVNRAPVSVVAVVLVVHSLLNGVLMARLNGDFLLGLRRIAERLIESDERLRDARVNEQRSITLALHVGPLADIEQLGEEHLRIVREQWRDPELGSKIAQAAAVSAQDALRALRRISHGIFPDELQLGLNPALNALTRDLDVIRETRVCTDRFHPAIESVFYAAAADVVRCATAITSEVVLVVQRDGSLLRLFAQVDVADGMIGELSPLLADRVAAIGGEMLVRRGERSLTLEVIAPTRLASRSTPESPRNEPLKVSLVDRHELLLQEAIGFSAGAALLGLMCSFGVLVVTRTWAGAAVFAVLLIPIVLLGLARRELSLGRYRATVAVLSATSCFAAIGLSALIPELAASAAVVATLPLFLASPQLDRRGLDVIAVVQALALATVGVLRYWNRPLIPSVVPRFFPQAVLLISVVGLFGVLLRMIIRITRTIEEATELARVAAQRAADEADAHRQALERDLHDGAQQQFVALSMQFRSLSKLLATHPEKASPILAVMETQLDSVRTGLAALASGSSLPDLEHGMLTQALRAAAKMAGHGVTVNVTVAGVDELDRETATIVYFCCHEGIQNAVKHGGIPLKVEVTVECRPTQVVWQVTDDGIGFDTSAPRATNGFRSLAARLGVVGGSYSVSSQAGEGTVLRGTLPRFTTQPVASTSQVSNVASTDPVK